jgi:hypothetical protein
MKQSREVYKLPDTVRNDLKLCVKGKTFYYIQDMIWSEAYQPFMSIWFDDPAAIHLSNKCVYNAFHIEQNTLKVLHS